MLLSYYNDHHSTTKWLQKISTYIEWNEVWQSVHNPLSSEDTTTLIWEQIHLNMYTTHSYNKWHKSEDPCPLCNTTPLDEFHITLHCTTVQNLWKEIEPHLLQIHPVPITEHEMAFGIPGKTKNITLRNWLTFLLRSIIAQQERIAYHNKKGQHNEIEIKINYNEEVKRQVWQHLNMLKNLDRLGFFQASFAVNDYLITWQQGQWQILTIFPIT